MEYDANVLFAHVSALREAREKDPHRPFDGALKVRASVWRMAEIVLLSVEE